MCTLQGQGRVMIRVLKSRNVRSVRLCQLSTPTYQSRKERELKKSSSDSPASVTPTLVDPANISVLGRVHKESDGSLPASKKKRADPSPTLRLAVRRNPAASRDLMI